MDHELRGPSRADLIQIAAQSGEEITPGQLRDWSAAGLLPVPRREGLGRGKGVRWFYRPGTERQLVALIAARRIKRRYGWIRWSLWWQGFDVDETKVRDAIESFATGRVRWADRADAAEDPDSDEDLWAEIEGSVPKQPRAPFLQFLQENAGPFGATDFITMSMKLAGGIEPEVDTPLARAIDQLAGDDVPVDFAAVAEMLDPRRLESAVKSASLGEIRAARDEVRAMVDAISSIEALIEDRLHPIVRDLVSLMLTNPQPDDQCQWLLLWITGRQSESARQAFNQAVAMIRLMSLGVMRPEDVEFPEE